ncbi:hypothetical protein M8C13_21380 [Crossiella sp. SN42]|uniref:hypothetical protein n=1 Tax=unclassified Crossiella TaxID=2620835 RepID=UPI00207D19C9|nr:MULTISPECIES: hypothetical protein [unclassified Crossiella]MCO1578309.1 hypothetical protein [Crossiella sp. SN42]WHT20058.1 hypothetical protein N8J89_03010 [Crossiella sp. CA-258035]
MASVEQVRNGILQANEKAQESLGALQAASTAIEQAKGALLQVVQGSNQPEAEQAAGMLDQAMANLTETHQQVTQAINTAEGYASRL